MKKRRVLVLGAVLLCTSLVLAVSVQPVQNSKTADEAVTVTSANSVAAMDQDVVLKDVAAPLKPDAAVPERAGHMANSVGLAPQAVVASGPAEPPVTRDPTDLGFGEDASTNNAVSFVLNAPGTMFIAGPTSGAAFLGAGDFGPEQTYDIMYVGDSGGAAGQLYTMDTATGATTVIGPCVAQGGETWTGFAYDENDGIMYATATNITTSGLYTIDLGTGAATYLGDTGTPAIIGLAVDCGGTLYAYDIVNDDFGVIDKTTYQYTTIGPLGFDANYGQGLEFDDGDGTLYMAAYNSTAGQPQLRIVNTADGSSTLVGALGAGQMGFLGINRSCEPYVPVYGACCDDYTGICTDDVEARDCPAYAGLRFAADTDCIDLDPTCGIMGACCVDFVCVATTLEADCDAMGGMWYAIETCPEFECPLTCEHSIELWDDYGDGWNGGAVDVLVNGTPVLTGLTLAGGAGPETHYFQAATGDAVTTVYTAGSWAYENSYYIYANAGHVLCYDGADGTEPVGCNVLGDCDAAPMGACCVAGDCVATNTEADCNALLGFWFEGETCPEYVCPEAPPNDDCDTATPVAGPYPQTVSGDNTYAMIDCPGVLDWNATWWAIDLPYASNTLTVNYCPTAPADITTVGIVIYADCTDCSAYIVDSYAFLDCGDGTTEPSVWWSCYPGPATVYLPVYIVTDTGEQTYTIDIDVTECLPVENDFCADAIAIGEVTDLAFDTSTATNDGIVPPSAYAWTCPDIWYCYTASCDGHVIVDLCGSTFDTQMAVWEGCDCPPTVEIGYNDDTAYCDKSVQSMVEFDAVEGQSYLIQVGGYSSNAGPGDLTVAIECEPDFGACCVDGFCIATTPTEEDCQTMYGGMWFANETCPEFLCPTGCFHTITLWDDYGDGWNGGFVDVYVNGMPVLAGVTIVTGGGPESTTFLADTGDTIDVVYTPDGWPEENEYIVYDGWNVPICMDGQGGAVPVGCSTIGNCDEPTEGACCHYDGTCTLVPDEASCIDGVFLGLGIPCNMCPDCMVICPEEATLEGEACGDDTNGGCNMDVPTFEPLECETIYCGTIWADGGTRDTDWYEIVTTEDLRMTWTGEGEFPIVIGYVPTVPLGSGDCSTVSSLDPYATGNPCDKISIVTDVLPPGIHWFFVSHQAFEGAPCGITGNNYTASLECELPVGACCFESAPYCAEMTEADCIIMMGTYLGTFTECSTNDCDGNGIPDECDIALGLAEDCQPNGIPDSCDVDPTDPDGNGEVSEDCQPNGVPDECELWIETMRDTFVDEGFEGTFPPTGWEHIATPSHSGNTTWFQGTSAYEGVYSAQCDYDPAFVDQDEWIISPAFAAFGDVTLTGAAMGSLYWGGGDPHDNYDTEAWLVVGADPLDGDDVFIGLLDENWPDTWVWGTFEYVTAAPGGEIRLGLRYVGNDGAQGNIDAVLLTGSAGAPPNDCNMNGIPDECDISIEFGGFCDPGLGDCSTDWNGNGIPDECEEECGDLNMDGAVDALDFDAFVDTYGLCDGDAGYNPLADSDGDNCIGLVDYQAWLACYKMFGPDKDANFPLPTQMIEPPAGHQGDLTPPQETRRSRRG